MSRCSQHGFAKQPEPCLRLIAGEGVEGDAHRGTTVQHLYKVRRDPTQPNLCQVHLFAVEMLAELADKGYALGPGEIGENVLTEGFDLLALPQGTLLYLGAEAVVKVTGLRTPCAQIDGSRAGLQKHLWGKRDAAGKRTRRAGIMGVVLTGGLVHAGESIHIKLPPAPHRPLGPV
ncbi:MAG: MOSC domain-containing protein [Janthinobacterium lividum]